MVKFEVTEKGYYVEWNDKCFDVLFMVYYPKGFQKEIVNGRIRLLPRETVHTYIVCPRTAGYLSAPHPGNLPSGLYSIRLCTDPSGENCEILEERILYLGHRVNVRLELDHSDSGGPGFSKLVDSGGPGFSKLVLRSACFIPRDHIWISYKAFVGNKNGKKQQVGLGVRTFLPEMRPDGEGGYFTECLIQRDGYRFVYIGVSEILADCVKAIKC